MKPSRAIELKKNDLIDLQITGMTAEGMGVGRYKDFAVFVPLTAPGDQIEAHVLKVLKHHAYAKVNRLISHSSDRIEPDCPVFRQCGGCCFRHISYEAELQIKENRVRDVLARIGGFPTLLVKPILGAEHRNGYRNKALFPLGKDQNGELIMGFYALNSHRIIDCAACRLQPDVFQAAANAFADWFKSSGETIYDEKSHTGKLRRLYLRQGETSGTVMVCLVINGQSIRHAEELVASLREAVPGLTGIMLNINLEKTNVALGNTSKLLWGSPFLHDTLCGLEFQISPLSFYQVNHQQTEKLYAIAAKYAALTGTETLLDLYCGIGTIGLSMAAKAKMVIGVEVVPEAVENARENAKRNQIKNAEFLCGDAAFAAAELKKRGEKPDVIVLDPPRKGCDPKLIETAASFSPQRIVYVSCDPATLARDLKYFAQLGFLPQEASPVDLFPATAHVETVVLLQSEMEKEKKGKQGSLLL